MRPLLLAAFGALGIGAAQAADPPSTKAPPPVAFVAPYNWTGLYVGAHLGGAWSSTTASAAHRAALIARYGDVAEPRGVFGGAQIGYRMQMPNNLVLGVELAGGAGPGFSDSVGIAGFSSLKAQGRWYALLGGTLGFAVNNWMPYIIGGLALGSFNANFTVAGVNTSITNTHTGFHIGGGLEYALNQNWSVGVEYRFIQFGKKTYQFPSVGSRISTVTAKVNYRF